MKESRTIQLAAGAIAAIGAVAVLGIGLLAWVERDIPDALSAAAGATVGALATLLTSYTPPGPIPGGRRATDPPP